MNRTNDTSVYYSIRGIKFGKFNTGWTNYMGVRFDSQPCLPNEVEFNKGIDELKTKLKIESKEWIERKVPQLEFPKNKGKVDIGE